MVKKTQHSIFKKTSLQIKKVSIIHEKRTVHTQLTGQYNFYNIAVAITMGLYFEVDKESIYKAIEEYNPQNHRSQIIELEKQTVVLDAYNANPSSMEAALYNFRNYNGSKAVILGDMFELGEESPFEHQKILDLVKSLQFEKNYFVGKNFQTLKNEDCCFFEDRESFETFLKDNPIQEANILIKGSRGIALEKLLPLIT